MTDSDQNRSGAPDDTAPDSGSGTSGAETGSDTDAHTGSNTDAHTGSNTDAHTGSNTDADSVTDPDPHPTTDPDPHPTTDPDADGGGVLPLFDHTHDPVTTALVVVFAAALGSLAAWLAADFGVRTAAFLVGALGTGYLLYGQPDRRAILAAGCYSLAALVALVPISYELWVVASVEEPLRHVLGTSDLLLLLAFWLLAAVPAIAGYRLSSGPFLSRMRARDRRPEDGS